MKHQEAVKTLRALANKKKAETHSKFFKETKNNIFIGVTIPQIRKLAKQFLSLDFASLKKLMHSNIHEERSLAHAILVSRFKKAEKEEQQKIFNFYIKNRKAIRTWNGVDDSAPYIVGAYLFEENKELLYVLIKSKNIWDRRIAIVSTWYFIRQNHFKDTLKLTEYVLDDEEDLIHKATGWMLREVGKKDVQTLETFLKRHLKHLPRTTLRYAIERFPETKRKAYLSGKPPSQK